VLDSWWKFSINLDKKFPMLYRQWFLVFNAAVDTDEDAVEVEDVDTAVVEQVDGTLCWCIFFHGAHLYVCSHHFVSSLHV
jgi:hypothetical protein